MIPQKIALLTDSCADISPQLARENHIFMVPLRILCADGEYLDGVNIRAGNHCAQPLLDHLGTGATARMSLAFYNTVADVERFLASLSTIRERMGYGR